MKRGPTTAFLLVFGVWYGVQVSALAQDPAAPAAGGRQARGPAAAPARPQAYPDRPKAPQDVLDRGKGLYGVNCAFCHG